MPDLPRFGDTAAGCLRALSRAWPARRRGRRAGDPALATAPSDCDHRPILIYGFHRGGTTYLQRLLNCSPEVFIWGEHAGVLSDYRRAYARFAAAPVCAAPVDAPCRATRNPGKWSPWVNKHSAVSYAELLRAHIIALFGIGDGRTRWGIKEIAYEDPADAAFMLRLFPDARIVLLRRDPVDLFLSQYFVKWNRKWREQGVDACSREFVERYHRRLAAFDAIASATPKAMSVDLESLRATPETFDRLIAFLGLSAGRFDRQAFAVASRRLVGSSFGDKGIEANAEAVEAARTRIEQALAEAEAPGGGSA